MAALRRPLALVHATPTFDLPELAQMLGAEGLALRPLTQQSELPGLLRDEAVELLLLEHGQPGVDVLGILHSLRSASGEPYRQVAVVVPTGDREAKLAALRLGADAVLSRDEGPELLAHLAHLLQLRWRWREQASTLGAGPRLRSRSIFLERLAEEFRRAQRYDEPLSLALLDVDGLGALNARLGHATGDEVLSELGPALLQAVRDTDICARLHGGSFAMLLPRTHLAGALTVSERVWRHLAHQRFGPERQVQLTTSLGVSGYPHRNVLTSEALLRTAEEALLHAKNEGRNRIRLFPESSHSAAE